MAELTNAILCYGFRLKDEDGEEGGIALDWLGGSEVEDDDDFDEFLDQLIGLPAPHEVFDEERFERDSEYQEEWRAYWRRQRRAREELGVTLVFHCSEKRMMYILAAAESEHDAFRGNPVALGQQIVAKPEWREQLRTFCERVGIRFEEPEWLLCSFWGK